MTSTKFSTWCVNTEMFKNEAIQRAVRAIEELKAGIAKNKIDAKNLGAEIQKLDELTAELHRFMRQGRRITRQRMRSHSCAIKYMGLQDNV